MAEFTFTAGSNSNDDLYNGSEYKVSLTPTIDGDGKLTGVTLSGDKSDGMMYQSLENSDDLIAGEPSTEDGDKEIAAMKEKFDTLVAEYVEEAMKTEGVTAEDALKALAAETVSGDTLPTITAPPQTMGEFLQNAVLEKAAEMDVHLPRQVAKVSYAQYKDQVDDLASRVQKALQDGDITTLILANNTMAELIFENTENQAQYLKETMAELGGVDVSQVEDVTSEQVLESALSLYETNMNLLVFSYDGDDKMEKIGEVRAKMMEMGDAYPEMTDQIRATITRYTDIEDLDAAREFGMRLDSLQEIIMNGEPADPDVIEAKSVFADMVLDEKNAKYAMAYFGIEDQDEIAKMAITMLGQNAAEKDEPSALTLNSLTERFAGNDTIIGFLNEILGVLKEWGLEFGGTAEAPTVTFPEAPFQGPIGPEPPKEEPPKEETPKEEPPKEEPPVQDVATIHDWQELLDGEGGTRTEFKNAADGNFSDKKLLLDVIDYVREQTDDPNAYKALKDKLESGDTFVQSQDSVIVTNMIAMGLANVSSDGTPPTNAEYTAIVKQALDHLERTPDAVVIDRAGKADDVKYSTDAQENAAKSSLASSMTMAGASTR